jgi:hypothetical protein
MGKIIHEKNNIFQCSSVIAFDGKISEVNDDNFKYKKQKKFFFSLKMETLLFSSKKVVGSPQFTPLTNPERSNLQSQNRN